MTSEMLQGMRVAILVTDGFEESEFLEPKTTLDHAGAATFVISPSKNNVRASGHDELGNGVALDIPVDIPLKSAKADDFHALFLPGGVMSNDHLRANPRAIEFVKHFLEGRKPVAAIGDGVSTILDAGAVSGRIMTSSPSLKAELASAGANWVDKDVVCDGNLITSRNANDIPAFDQATLRLFFKVRVHSTDMRRTA